MHIVVDTNLQRNTNMTGNTRSGAISVLGLVALVSMLSAGTTYRTPTSGACRGPDSFSRMQIENLQFLLRSTDLLDISFRTHVQLPIVPDSAVQLVTDDSICTQAVARWKSENPVGHQSLTSLYVIRVGSGVYDTIDPAPPSAEWSQHMVLDGQLRRVSVYLY